MELIIFLWVVGWMYACGQADFNIEEAKKYGVKTKNRLAGYAVLFFLWPHYIGYK